MYIAAKKTSWRLRRGSVLGSVKRLNACISSKCSPVREAKVPKLYSTTHQPGKRLRVYPVYLGNVAQQCLVWENQIHMGVLKITRSPAKLFLTQ